MEKTRSSANGPDSIDSQVTISLLYLDDIVMLFQSVSYHLSYLGSVLDVLSDSGVSSKKCSSFDDKIDYLCHVINQESSLFPKCTQRPLPTEAADERERIETVPRLV